MKKITWTLVPLLTLAVVSPALAQADVATKPTAESIMKRYIEAVGGEKALKKLENRKMTAKMTVVGQGLEGTVVEYAAPPMKHRMTADFGFFKQEEGSDGEIIWSSDPMTGTRILTGDERIDRVASITFHNHTEWKKLYPTREYKGIEEVGGKKLHRVDVTPASGNPQSWYFDPETGLQERMHTVAKVQMGDIDVKSHTVEWGEFDGVKYPVKVDLDQGGMSKIKVEVTSIEHNVEIPEGTFELPEAVQKLAEKQKAKEAEKAKEAKGEEGAGE